MPLNLTVTPGVTFVSGSLLTVANMNAAANPTVTVADGSIPAVCIDAADFVTTFGGAFRAVNYLPWGSFHFDAFKSASAIACAASVRTSPVAGWSVLPTGAAVTAERSTTVPDTASGHSLKVTSAGGITALRVCTYVPPAVTCIAQGTIVFSAYIYNGTGTAFTPSLEVETSSAGNDGDEGALDAAATVAGSVCANGAWTRVSFTISTAVITAAAWRRGAHLSLKITAAAGVLTEVNDYILVAQAAIDKTALSSAWIPNLPALPAIPTGMQLPWPGASTTIPAGWLLCNGQAVSRTTYRNLFEIVGTAYGVGDGATTFNVPDLRGSIPVGAEVSGAAQSRMEYELAGSATTNASPYITVSSSANLRKGMAAYHANIPAGAVIETIVSSTSVKLSANATATASPVTIRFSKLGAADAETIGAAGDGTPLTFKRISLTLGGCSTVVGTTLTVPTIANLACGMLVDCTNVPAGTTIAAFLTATTVRLSAAGTGVGSGLTATFRVDAADSEQEETYRHLLRNPTIANCSWDPDVSAPYKIDTLPVTSMLSVGMTVSGDTIPAGQYITAVNATELECGLSMASGNTGYPSGVDLTFSGSASTSVGGSPPGPRMVAQNWMIKY